MLISKIGRSCFGRFYRKCHLPPLLSHIIRRSIASSTPYNNAAHARANATKKGKRRVKVDRYPANDTMPHPLLTGLPMMPFRGTFETAVAAENGYTFKTLDMCSSYIDRYLKANDQYTLPMIQEGRPLDDKNTFKVTIRLQLKEGLLAEEHTSHEYIIGVGEGSKLQDAKNIARLDLAERLFRLLKEPAEYLNEREKKMLNLSATKFIPIDLSAGLRRKLAQTCRTLNETALFRIAPGVDEARVQIDDDQGETRAGLEFKALSSHVIKGLKTPERETSRLPICKLYHRLIESVERNNVTILSAATGSGKTTQLPQYILDCFKDARDQFERPPSVLVTQPRRIAAKSVAQRVADEREKMCPGTGRAVGYTVRFDSKPPSHSRDGTILFCTAGILLRRLQNEPDLMSVTHLILDEVHERDVFTDILLLVTRSLLRRRPDLRVILMSATMEANKFVQYFEEANFSVGAVLDIEGTNHPVTHSYLDDIVARLERSRVRVSSMSYETQNFIKAELSESNSDSTLNMMNKIVIEDNDLEEIPFDVMAALIEDINMNEEQGAILVFLPGWEEITELNSILQSRLEEGKIELHLLHSTSPIGSADAAFRVPPPGVRKIILATNIAESSVTIPDVVYVIDSGKQKVMHYDQRLRMNVLEPCWISKANLRQRLGRAGRCRPGKYFAMFSRRRAQSLPDQTLPELLRLGLDEVCLNLKAMGFREPSSRLLATAIDPPDRMAVKAAIDRLKSIGAIDEDELLTPLGRLLSNIPIHPTMGKMLITAQIFGCLGPVLTTVALLGQKIFRPCRLPNEKYDLHAFYSRFAPSLASDHLMAHKIYTEYKQNGHNLGPEMYRFENCLSRAALRRLDDSRSQILRELGNSFGELPNDPDEHSSNDGLVRLVLTAGFYPEVAMRGRRKNVCELRMVGSAIIGTSSMLHSLGSTSIRTALEGRLQQSKIEPLLSKRRRHTPQADFFIYEELVDVGHKLISKVTAVDPLFFILFSSRTPLIEYASSQEERPFKQMQVDGWLPFRANPPAMHRDLMMLAELRLHWNDFVQFIIYKKLRNEQLSPQETACAAMLRDVIMMLVKESNILRPMMKDNAKEVPRGRIDASQMDRLLSNK